MTIEIRFDGKKIKPEDLGQALGRKALDALEDQLERQLRDRLCPTHRRPPKIKLIRSSGKVRPEITACCKEFEKTVHISLR